MNDVDLTPPAPDDLGFRYSWREGSVPPPYHYEYTISVGPRGDGVVVFRPDYPEEGAPAWEERFRVPESQVDEVYRLMLEARVFAARWETEPDPPVGGSLEWLEVVAQGERHTVPSTLRRPEAVEPLYAFIRALVPEDTWAKLRARQEDYQAAYGDG